MELSSTLLEEFVVGREFDSTRRQYNSIDFHQAGDLLVASGDGELQLYDVRKGKLVSSVDSTQHGCSRIVAANEAGCALAASNNSQWDESIGLWNLADRKLMRRFSGHVAAVMDMVVCPTSSTLFASSSVDGVTRFWDTRTTLCQGVFKTLAVGRDAPTLAYGPQGLVLAIASSAFTVQLFDTRNVSAGSFATFHVPKPDTSSKNCYCTGVSVSPDGRSLYISCSDGPVTRVDAFSGERVCVCAGGPSPDGTSLGPANPSSSILQMSTSPDSRYLLSGSEDGVVHCWDVTSFQSSSASPASSQPVPVDPANSSCQRAQLVRLFSHSTSHYHKVKCAQWSPSQLLFATAGQKLNFWIPKRFTGAQD
mmetsp:Transcript_41418/g.81194  ORF Transcript_41418/g.81194 Transcript_41418/m.81194 type:complete len:365 (-) Transcript_41418:2-1096(-)